VERNIGKEEGSGKDEQWERSGEEDWGRRRVRLPLLTQVKRNIGKKAERNIREEENKSGHEGSASLTTGHKIDVAAIFRLDGQHFKTWQAIISALGGSNPEHIL
jgi:hypothetical protein